ncbi:uncharacterized protein C8Q71DRAFT_833691 [Rhodofomes roseus]|uniref:SRP9 domain-containing protein n=1 Tax=Rhodofomes roseus TaxID=34475 RepID=A0ABQ8KJA4_9APHY|nr:uncharacterized protein C8Q71DRAFT_833691 [Rhodofomes roseus]KAH9837895.1 hypothetical protein C8Q71DRAFT_833691 [Rhodofomes roseus]
MVYISSWQEYQEAAEALYEKSPNTARYCVKWRAADGKLVLKITDNTTVSKTFDSRAFLLINRVRIQCLKFKTSSSVFLNRFEALNLSLMQKMTNRQAKLKPGPSQIDTPHTAEQDRSSTPVPGTSGVSSGGVKKKKPKKKK